ncbi:hypothetical protein [Nitrosomonas sp.]|uniref:hypothetical protein n=1 Tax=Nitrosomonas sp. TaxID=42353 RepID=UPI00262BA533|nr:hypothetical protein [Nitrosomonas sp.]
MDAIEIIKYLREQDFSIKADGEYLELSPPEKITEELLQRLRLHKPAILLELKREKRRMRVLTMLAENSGSERAIISDSNFDPASVILAIAIRDQYTFELLLPREKYDAFFLLEVIEKGQIQ